MMKVPPRLIRGFQVIALLVIIVMGFIKIRRYLAIDDCLDHGHRWDHGRDACAER
jgi:hypothetical protein